MKTKQLIFLTIILALLISGIIWKQSQKRPEVIPPQQEYVSLDLSFEAEQVSEITLSKPGGNKEHEVKLVKENGIWKIPGLWQARAEKGKIESLLEEVKRAKGEVRGKGRHVFSDFGIEDDRGVFITLKDALGKELLAVVLGDKRDALGNIFIRRKSDEIIFMTDAKLYRSLGIFGDPAKEEPKADFWATKNIAFINAENVEKVEIKKWENGHEMNEVSLNKQGKDWVFAQPAGFPFAPGTEAVKNYLSTVQNAAAQEILDPNAKDYGFANPLRQVKITSPEQETVLTVGSAQAPENNIYLQSSSEPVVFLVSKYQFENLVPEILKWIESNNPFKIDPAKVERLVIQAGKVQKSFKPKIQKNSKVDAYLENLKSFRVEKFVEGKAKFGKYWIEIQQEEMAPMILDVAEAANADQSHTAQVRTSPYLFNISESVFKMLFNDLARLDEQPANKA